MSSAGRYADTAGRRRWRARWVGPDGRGKEKKGFGRKGDAEAYAADREAEARHGVTLDGERPSGRTTVAQWTATWLAAQEVRPSTASAYAAIVKRIDGTLGSRELAGLRPSELKAWRRGLALAPQANGKPYSDATVQQTAAVLAMILRAAVHDGLLERSPLPPNRGGSGGRVVDPEELLTLQHVQAWGKAMPEVACEMPIVAATTGLRRGELLALQPGALDLLRRELRVTPLGNLGATREYGPPKTAAGVRTVPLPHLAVDALARHLARYPPVDGEPVFRDARGNRWSPSTFHDVESKARVVAKLPGWAHWHALRDVGISSMIRAGLDLRIVMAAAGHTSSEETLRTYARLWKDSGDRARKALDDLWSAADGQDLGAER